MGTVRPNRTLNPKQLAFVREYQIDFNGTQAAIRAGYSAKTAYVKANYLTNNSLVQEAIQKAQTKVAVKCEITVEKILDELAKMAFHQEEIRDADKLKAMELAGKHIGMFIEQHKITAVVDVTTHELTDDERAARLAELTGG